jgi:hypothetical protein
MTSTDITPRAAASAAEEPRGNVSSEASRRRMKTSSNAGKKRTKNLVAGAVTQEKAAVLIAADTPFSEAPSKAAAVKRVEKPRPTKASVVEALLIREGGARLEALREATGWKPHTCRAFLTGLRKKGREVIRASDRDGKSIYLIAPDRSNEPSGGAEQITAETN